ncbi:MAG: hypothetical protein OEX12_05380 [Gammaproteobacteria bacterium]|nr:hypothetical protein [Gammaproteobacteria bacterium]
MKQSKPVTQENNILSNITSCMTLFILAIATYAIAMFMLSSSNYQTAVSVTSTIENRVLNLRSEFNKQAQLWNHSSFVKLNRVEQERIWKKFVVSHHRIQAEAISTFADIKDDSKAKQQLGMFLGLYTDLSTRYEYQKQRMEIGDEVSFTSQRNMTALVNQSNTYLDQTLKTLRSEIVALNSNNNMLIDSGSLASVVALALIIPMMLFLSAGMYYRQRVL